MPEPGSHGSPGDIPLDVLGRRAIDALSIDLAVLDSSGEVVKATRVPPESRRGEDAAIGPGAVGENYPAVLGEADDERLRRAAGGLRRLVDGEDDRFAVEYSRPSSDGRRRFLMRAVPFEADDVRYVAVGHVDVTDGGSAERSFEEHKARAMDAAPVGITISDPDREDNPVVYANGTFERITGYPVDEVVGRNCRFLQGAGTDTGTVARMREAIEDEEPVTVEVLNYRRDGEPFWNEVTIAPIREAGEVTNYVGFQKDVTERRRTQEALEEGQETLALLNQIVRHDIRNDMSVVLGWTDALADTGADPEYVDRIERAARHVVELTRTVGELADTVTGESSSDPEPVALGPVLRESVDRVDSVYERRSEDVRIEAPEAFPDVDVLADDLLSSVFSNLLSNAVLHNDKATPRVEVSVEVDGGTATVRIADNGPGIHDELKETAFGRGEKALDSPGMGLGLYLVETLVSRYGGEVRLSDNEPEGTVAAVELRRP